MTNVYTLLWTIYSIGGGFLGGWVLGGGVSVEFVNTGPCCSCTLLSLFATKCLSTSPLTDWHARQADRKRKSKPIMFRAGIYQFSPVQIQSQCVRISRKQKNRRGVQRRSSLYFPLLKGSYHEMDVFRWFSKFLNCFCLVFKILLWTFYLLLWNYSYFLKSFQ